MHLSQIHLRKNEIIKSYTKLKNHKIAITCMLSTHDLCLDNNQFYIYQNTRLFHHQTPNQLSINIYFYKNIYL